MKEEIRRIKEEEEQAMREALGLAPKRASKSQGNRLDKHEFAELVKPCSTAEDLGAGHAEAAQVQGFGFSGRGVRPGENSSLPTPTANPVSVEKTDIPLPTTTSARKEEKEMEDESGRKKRKHEEKKREKHERRDKRHSRESDDKRKQHKKHKEKRRHDSD
ncbi:hypothetical protein ABFX02_06G084700 [Erythranthe guttata]